MGGRLVGYARVSTEDQATRAQEDQLRAAGCTVIYRERASGASRARPELARLLAQIQPGDVLTVVRLDRLARSVRDLLEIVDTLQRKGAYFRSLSDPIDTSTPQGMFSLQVLGAVAQLERALISERTKAGVAAARARGRLPGNPGLRHKDKAALAKASAARRRRYVSDLIAGMDEWMPVVERMRPDHSWEDIAHVLSAPATKRWTPERLRRAAKRLVAEGLAERDLLRRAPTKRPDDRVLRLVASIALANPDMSLRKVAAQLEAMRECTPRKRKQWNPSSVKALLDRARREGLLAGAFHNSDADSADSGKRSDSYRSATKWLPSTG